MRASIRGECKLPTTIKDDMMRALVARNARRAQHARATPLRFTIQELDTIGTTGSVSNNRVTAILGGRLNARCLATLPEFASFSFRGTTFISLAWQILGITQNWSVLFVTIVS